MGKHSIESVGPKMVSFREAETLTPTQQKVRHYTRKTTRTVLRNGHHVISIVSLHVVALTVLDKVPHILHFMGVATTH